MARRIILVARYYSIEPLGIMYLAGVAKDAGWELKVVLIHEYDFEPLYELVRSWQPDFVGFQIWTGYHLPAFTACDRVQAMGVPVIIGGPHATYFHKECEEHATFVAKGEGFRIFHNILTGEFTEPRTYFDQDWAAGAFPLPDRNVVYEAYPEIGASPIKSIFASVGCPYTCTYCYAPAKNAMYGGFKFNARPVDDLVAEANAIKNAGYPLSMVYFQDDIFGFKLPWLRAFAQKWSQEVKVPFHCQIRLELTQHKVGDERLDLFKQAGCTGITLAIESGNAFLRDQVLFRHMDEDLIVEGCRKILDRGMTLRIEQILAVPFSNSETDLATLDLNHRINPTMAWTSILSPFAGTDMGTIANKFGFYEGNNDDLSESFFDRSVLRHVHGGPDTVDRMAKACGAGPRDRFLLTVETEHLGDSVRVTHPTHGELGVVEFLTPEENEQYRTDCVRLQRLFMWVAKVPGARKLGETLIALPEADWSWRTIGEVTHEHLLDHHDEATLTFWRASLAYEMGFTTPAALPEAIAQNPWFFVFHPAGGLLAQATLDRKVFERSSFLETLDVLGTLSRRHLFHYGLYRIEEGRPAIVTRVFARAA